MALIKFSKAKALLVFLAAVTFAVSASTLGLSAHGVAWYRDSGGMFVKVRVWNETDNANGGNMTHYTTQLAYQPTLGLDMSDMYALLMAGILGTLLGFIILVASVWAGKGKMNVSLTGRSVRPIHILGSTTTLILEACLLVTFIATAGYAWTQASNSFHYIDTSQIASPQTNFTWYYGNDFYTFEYWNCALSYAAASSAVGPSSGELYGLCKQARAARILGLVLFVLAVIMLVAHFWAWRRHNIAVRLAKAHGYGDGDDVVRAKKSSLHSSSEQTRHGRGGSDAVELPAYRLSRIEAPDSAVGEMAGENGSKELQAENVALEMDAERGNGEKT